MRENVVQVYVAQVTPVVFVSGSESPNTCSRAGARGLGSSPPISVRRLLVPRYSFSAAGALGFFFSLVSLIVLRAAKSYWEPAGNAM